MQKKSAGLLMYRRSAGRLEVFLVHPGGPYWANKDDGVWSVPKGEFSEDEEPLAAARREFEEETGFTAVGDFIPLKPLKQSSGKTVYVWAVEGDCDPRTLRSNTFEMEWPPRSGRVCQFPEVDRGEWFSMDEGKRKLVGGQVGFLDQLTVWLGARRPARLLDLTNRRVCNCGRCAH